MTLRPPRRAGVPLLLALGLLLGACAGSPHAVGVPAAPAPSPGAPAAVATRAAPQPRPLPPPILPPETAWRQGWMPLAATGVDRCRPVESALGRPEYEIPSAGTVARAEPGSDDVWATQGALAPGGAK